MKKNEKWFPRHWHNVCVCVRACVCVCVCACVMLVTGSLQIRQSVESDEGKYECVAQNSVGLTFSYGANLYVRGQSARMPLLTM